MELIDKYNQPKKRYPLVVTIGFFDGVHSGHRFLIDQIISEAKSRALKSAVITFSVHPRKVLLQDYQPALLCGYEEKIERLASTGIDYCIALDFTLEMAKLSAREFIHQILKDQFNVDTLIIGYDHRFGHNREEGLDQYKLYGQEVGIKVMQAAESNPQEHVSSTRIRRLLGNGDVRKAAKFLSYNYTISGTIVEGFKVGRTIGFPTANVQHWEDFKVIPAFGVYAVYVHIADAKYSGMLYIGKRPTLQNGENVSVEVNIFDFDEDLYNKSLTVELIDFVRADQKFSNIETLKAQIFQDKKNVQQIMDKENLQH